MKTWSAMWKELAMMSTPLVETRVDLAGIMVPLSQRIDWALGRCAGSKPWASRPLECT